MTTRLSVLSMLRTDGVFFSTPQHAFMTRRATTSLLSFTGGADKSLARPGRKQATTTEDFDFYISYL